MPKGFVMGRCPTCGKLIYQRPLASVRINRASRAQGGGQEKERFRQTKEAISHAETPGVSRKGRRRA